MVWVTAEQHAALLRGEALGTLDPEPHRIAAFCVRNRVPWSTPSTAIACFGGEVPRGIAAQHRGEVRLTLDVEWLLEEVRMVCDGRLADLLLALDDRQQRGLEVWKELRTLRVLGGAPADRGDAIAALVRDYRGSHHVEARIFRGIDLDDIDAWVPETGLPILEA